MKRSSTISQVSETEDSSSSDFYLNTNSLAKSFNSLCISTTNLSDCERNKLIPNDEESFKKNSDNSVNIIIDNSEVTCDTINKSKSLVALNNIDKIDNERDALSLNQSQSKNDLKLVSPYGDWCAFS